jgi:predicted Zn-dependent peptidase
MIDWDQYPKPALRFIVMFGCSPKTTDKLTKAVFGEMKKILKKGPTEIDLKKAQEALIRKRETDMEKNEFWLAKLESIFYNHDSQGSVLQYKDLVNAVTIADLKKTAVSCIKPDHYVRVVLMPEQKK